MHPHICTASDLNNPEGKHWHPDTPGNLTTRFRHAVTPATPATATTAPGSGRTTRSPSPV